jgi:hypothetical protein
MMNRSSSFIPHQRSALKQNSKGAVDFLRNNDRLASLLPTVTRINALQNACAAILPAMFPMCAVLHADSEQLVIAVPNAAVASKLKNQLPKLQENLLKRGWQVNSIRLKVQVIIPIDKTERPKQIALSNQAMSAFADLEKTLEDTPANSALKAALGAMLARHLANR